MTSFLSLEELRLRTICTGLNVIIIPYILRVRLNNGLKKTIAHHSVSRSKWGRWPGTRHLLNHVESDRRELGNPILEAYPSKRSLSCEHLYMGPFDLYKKNGIDMVKEFEKYYLVRKDLY